MRSVYEDGVSFDGLAAMCGIDVETVERRARKDGWRRGGEGYDDLLVRLRCAHGRAVAELDAGMRQAADGSAGVDKARVDAAASALKAAERLEDSIERARNQVRDARERTESAKEEQERRDAEMSEILGRIDRQIVELARGYARELVEEGFAAGDGHSG